MLDSVVDPVDVLENNEKLLFVTHRHADRDSLGSAIGLKRLLGRGKICTPDGIASPAQSLLELIETKPVTSPRVEEYDAVVVLDAPSTERIASVEPANPVVIDHHETGNLSEIASAMLVDTDAGATAALVTRLALDAGWDLTSVAALPLLVGVLDDTGFLQGADPDTVKTATHLVGELGDRADDLPGLIERAPRSGEEMAQTLGTLRANGYRAGDTIVAVTAVGGYETATAHQLRTAGADLAIVCSEQDNGLRVTARASESVADQINLGRSLLPALAAEFGGDGGGHDGAGVARLESGSPPTVEEYLITWLERELGVTFGAVNR